MYFANPAPGGGPLRLVEVLREGVDPSVVVLVVWRGRFFGATGVPVEP